MLKEESMTIRALPESDATKSDNSFLLQYFEDFRSAVSPSDQVISDLILAKQKLVDASHSNKKIIVLGNGGSAAIASHFSVDLTKNAGIRSINFNEADLLTCFSNDFGYQEAYAKAVEFYGDPGDILIAISSSGKSSNIIKSIQKARDGKFSAVLTFSGMENDNPLKQLGDINFWVDSFAYNLIENTHQVWLLSIVDLIIGKSVYSA